LPVFREKPQRHGDLRRADWVSDENQIFIRTGNPFVDAGIYAIMAWMNKNSMESITKKDIEEFIPMIVDLYLKKKWNNQLMGMVFPNSPITNPSSKDKRKGYTEYLSTLINSIPPLGCGDCISCGRRNATESLGRANIPLTGSGTFRSFFPHASQGVKYCPACTFAIQVMPTMLRKCGLLMLLQSNSDILMRLWVKDAIKHITHEQIGQNAFTGMYSKDENRPTNTLFQNIQNIIVQEKHLDLNASIRVYYFNSNNRKQDLRIFDMPNRVFRFLIHANDPTFSREWSKIVVKGYAIKKDETLDENTYKKHTNTVYENLLNEKSIISYFIDKENKRSIGSWELIAHYLKDVKRMEKEQITAIKELADNIAGTIRASGETKRLGQLERASKPYTFRNVLLRIERDRVSQKLATPLTDYEGYVSTVMADSLYWADAQNLILFRIYEQLHEWLVENEYAPKPEEEKAKTKEEET